MFPNWYATMRAFGLTGSSGDWAICSAMNHSGEMNGDTAPTTSDIGSKTVKTNFGNGGRIEVMTADSAGEVVRRLCSAYMWHMRMQEDRAEVCSGWKKSWLIAPL